MQEKPIWPANSRKWILHLWLPSNLISPTTKFSQCALVDPGNLCNYVLNEHKCDQMEHTKQSANGCIQVMPFRQGIPYTCLHKKLWYMSAARWNKGQFSKGLCIFGRLYWQVLTNVNVGQAVIQALQIPIFTSLPLTLIALTYFPIAGSCWPHGSSFSWCQLWTSLAGNLASHPALGMNVPKFNVCDIYLLILCTSWTNIGFTSEFVPAGNPLGTHALLSPVKHIPH